MAATPSNARSHLSLVPDLADPPPLPSRRGPRRDTTAGYTLRVELDGIEPAIWRRFTVPSDLMLDALHPVLQTVMGWTDSHLHGFVSGEKRFSAESERFEIRHEVAEPLGFGPPGYAAQAYEDEVRLDEVLAEVGDTLFYTYDFGDAWEHVVVLEGVNESTVETASGTVPACLDGARACPPEDCGGVPGYEQLLTQLASHEPVGEQDLDDGLSARAESAHFDPEAFDADAVSEALRAQVEVQAPTPADDTPLGRLLARVAPQRVPDPLALLPPAGLGAGEELTAEEVERATQYLRWLLRVIGPDER